MSGFSIDKKRTAILMVAVLLVSSVAAGILINYTDENTSAEDTYIHPVTYHPNNFVDSDVTVSYDGIIATEYNPLYWANSFKDNTGATVTTNWTAPTETYSYSGAGSRTLSKVFAGWSEVPNPTSVNQLHDPGDVISSEITQLWAYWVFPDLYRYNSVYYEKLYVSSNSNNWRYNTASSGGTAFNTLTESNYVSGDALTGVSKMYTRQFLLFNTITIGNTTTTQSNMIKIQAGSYRSDGDTNYEFKINGRILLAGDVVIDKVKLTTIAPGSNHGYGDYGLFGNGHKLIMGAGITNENPIYYNSNSRIYTAPQIYGGGYSTLTSVVVDDKEIISGFYDRPGKYSGDDDNLYGLKVDLGTYVIIHSGTYGNVFGGGSSQIGDTSHFLSTYLVMKGGKVLDTVCGGNQSGNTIYGASGTVSSAAKNARQGGTFLYVIGADLPGDYWSATRIGLESDYGTSSEIAEAVALVGGSAVATIIGSSHVFLSGNASAWDAQGGGRSGSSSYITFGYVEATGSSTVRHIMCGAITDGCSTDNTLIYGTKVVVADNAKIATLCGAGYDTWSNPSGTSMADSDSIEVLVTGGTVGFVYGGGYRGTVGKTSNAVDISVKVLGGTIEYDVFGGGRGGLEKAIVDKNGKITTMGYWINPTGFSKSYANIDVEIEDATINGNVYAAGESIASLTSYKGYNGTNSNYTNRNFSAPVENVAEVIGSTKVTVSGDSDIKGSVFGSGKGIAMNGTSVDANYRMPDGTVVASDYYAKIVLYGKDGLVFNDWFIWNNNTITYSTTGVDNYAKVTGNSTVIINGGTIGGSVYGGGALGITEGDTNVTINGGTIHSNVFGGGLGTLGKLSVRGNTMLTITGGNIDGSIFGGAENGIIDGSTALYINGGYVAGNAFVGGLGGLTYTSVKGKREARFDGGNIEGSLYGGSSLGNDVADSGDADADIFIISGEIGGSVFGGGYKGTTVGSSRIFVGYQYDGTTEYSGVRKSLTIGQSIYGGGDVGDLGDGEMPFDPERIIFTGNTNVKVSGSGIDITFTGSIFGSGNSCIIPETSTATIEVKDLVLEDHMESIHRADYVTVWGSNLKFNGREGSDGTNTKYSFYKINNLRFKDSTTVYLYSLMMDIDEYASVGQRDNLTVASSPSNSIVICDGTLFAVQKRNSTGGMNYGRVLGYTMLSLINTETYYGAYAMGDVESIGGFVIQSGGTYKVADSIYSDDCRCWFVTGAIQLSQSVTTDKDTGESSAVLSIPKVANYTGMRYAGAYFIPASDEFSLVDTIEGVTEEGRFNAVLGGDDTYNTTFNSENGAVLKQDISLAVPFMDDKFIAGQTFGGLSEISLVVKGTTKGVDLNVGYLMIYLQEFTVAKYTDSSGVVNDLYIVQNRCDVRIDLYTSGNALDGDKPNIPDVIDIEISATTTAPGYGEVIIPQGLVNYDVNILSVTSPSASEKIPLKVESAKNTSNSDGWANGIHHQYAFNKPGSLVKLPVSLGATQGGYSATIRFSVDRFIGEDSQLYTFSMKVDNGEGKSKTFTVNVTISLAINVDITFHDEHITEGTITISYPYGTSISEAMCPVTAENFVGWYIDADFNNPYNYNTLLISDFDLYSKYAFKVTFNNMNGSMSNVYVSQGSTISRPSPAPTWLGHEFDNWYWYNEAGNLVKWHFDNDADVLAHTVEADVVNKDTEIIAKWIGNPAMISFFYDDTFGEGAEHMVQLEDASGPVTDAVEVGGTFGDGDVIDDLITYATTVMKGKIPPGSDLEFVRWELQMADGTLIFSVYDDTEVPINISTYLDHGDNTVHLVAHFSEYAIQIDLDKNADGDEQYVTIEAPVHQLIFPTGDEYRFFSNNATRSNGYTLIGWCTMPHIDDDGARFVDTSSEWTFPLTTPSGTPITLYAIWEKIEYTITVVKPNGGTVTVIKDNTVIGNTDAGDVTFIAYYGDVFTVNYAAGDSGYQFNNWSTNGEAIFDRIENVSSSFVVEGSAAIYAKLAGLVQSTLWLRVDGLPAADDLPVYLVRNGNIKELVKDGEYNYGGKEYARYIFTSNVTTFDVAIGGDQSRRYVVGTFEVTVDGRPGAIDAVSINVSGLQNKEHLIRPVPQYVGAGATFEFEVNEHYKDVSITAMQSGETISILISGNVYSITSASEGQITITGSFAPKEYDVEYKVTGEFSSETFYFDFGSGDEDAPYEVQAEYGSTVGLPVTVKDADGNVIRGRGEASDSDYVLIGWYPTAEHNTDKITSPVTVSGNTELFAYITSKTDVHYTVAIYQRDSPASGYVKTNEYDESVVEGKEFKAVSVLGYRYASSDPADYKNVVATERTISIYFDIATGDQEVSFGGVAASSVPEGWTPALDWQSMTKTVSYGEEVILPELVKEGYRLIWMVDSVPLDGNRYVFDKVTQDGNSDYSLDAVTITATFEKKSYKLTLTTLHGNFSGQEKVEITVEYGATIMDAIGSTVPTGYTGYTLSSDKWLKADGTVLSNTETMPAADIMLRANLIANSYTIIFDLNGGTGTVTNIDAKYDKSANLPTDEGLTRTGFELIGWNTLASGAGTNYSLGATVINLCTDDGDSIILFAKWEVKKFTLTIKYVGCPEPIDDYVEVINYNNSYDVNSRLFDWYDVDKARVYGRITEDTTITVTYTPTPFDITYDLDGGTVTGNPDSYNIESGAITLINPEKTGYDFAGWTGTDVAVPTMEVTIPAGQHGDRSYVAHWNVKSYTITWKNDDDTLIDTTIVNYGVVPTHADAVKESTVQYTYTFAGWDPALVAVTGDATYTATFTPVLRSYAISFQNEDVTALQNLTVLYGDVPVYTEATPVKESTAQYTYTFADWTPAIVAVTGDATYTATFTPVLRSYAVTFSGTDLTVKNGNVAITSGDLIDYGTVLTLVSPELAGNDNIITVNGSPYTQSTVTVEGTLNITQSYTPRIHTITYYVNGNVAKTDSFAYGETVVPYTYEPPSGFDFSGWTPSTFPATMPDEDLEYTGTTTATVFSVTFVVDDEIVIDSYTIVGAFDSYTAGIAVDLPTVVTIVPDGYTFEGWYDNDGRTGSVCTQIPTSSTGDLTFYAGWDVKQFTITFDTDGGTAIPPITQDYNTGITAPGNPTKEGYTFSGWDQAIPEKMPAEDMTIKALWTIAQFTISFDTDGGTPVASITQNYGTTVVAPASPTKNGYIFAGWSVIFPLSMPAEDFTVVALWYSVSDYNAVYDGAAHTIVVDKSTLVTVTYSDTVDGIYTDTPSSYTDVGDYETFYKVTLRGDEIGAGSKHVVITRAPVAIPVPAQGLVYNGSAQNGVAAGTGYSIVSGNTETTPGNYEAIVAVDGNHKWSDETITNKAILWSIAKKVLTVTADDKEIEYGQSPPIYTVEYSGFVPGESSSDLGGSISKTSDYVVGSGCMRYDIRVSGLESDNYAITYVDGKLNVTPKHITELNWDGLTGNVYNKQKHDNIVATPVGLLSGDTCSVYFQCDDYISAGSHTVTAIGLSNSNYILEGTLTGQLIIAPKEVVLSWGWSEFPYNGQNQAPTANALGLESGDSCTVTVSGAASDAGNHTATAVALSNSNYRLPAVVTRPYTIIKGNYDMSAVSMSELTLVYDREYHTITVTGTLPTGKDGIQVTVNYTGGSTDAGTYTVTATFATTSVNYNVPAPLSRTLKIEPKTVEITGITAANKPYDGTTAVGLDTSGAVISGLISGDDLSIVFGTGAFPTKDAGTHQIVFTGYGLGGTSAGNYQLVSQPVVSATITKILLDISIMGDYEITYGEQRPDFMVSYTGFIPGEDESDLIGTLYFDCNYEVGSKVGNYWVMPAGVSSNNYNINLNGTMLKVNRINTLITITTNSATIPGNDDTILTDSGYEFTQGILIPGDVLTVKVNGKQIGIGESYNSISFYSITHGNVDVTNCYRTDLVAGILKIVLGRNVDITNGSSATYDKDVIDIEGYTGGMIADGAPFDLKIKAKVDVKRIDVVVKMGGTEIDAFNRESDTSGNVHIDSVTDDIEIVVTYSNSDGNGFNIIPFIIIGIIILIVVAGIAIYVKKKREGDKPESKQ